MVQVTESSTGGDVTPLYYDGLKYMDFASTEDFAAGIEAYSTPREFDACDGVRMLSPGLFATQQPRKTFDLCYKTLIGNDLEGVDYAYKLHLVYNITAAPSGRTNKTLAGTVSPDTRSWVLSAVPPPATTFRPTAHLVVDSRLVDPYSMADLESVLYGKDARSGTDPAAASPARMPSVSEIIALLSNGITDLITEPI